MASKTTTLRIDVLGLDAIRDVIRKFARPSPQATSKQAFLAATLKDGEHYAGILLGKDGAPDHHLILLPGEAENVTWSQAKEWAAHAGGELPTRREQSLLFANLKEQFQPRWHWSGEQHAANSDCAWCQDFNDGNQDNSIKHDELRARAVRRVAI